MDEDQETDLSEQEQRLADLGDRIEETRKAAADDLLPGGSGRTFTDEGVRAQVEEFGDTEHHRAD